MAIAKKQLQFKKGDYVVPLKDKSTNNNWTGWVLKQRGNSISISPIQDPNTKSTTCCWADSSYSRRSDWRYATPQEIAAYDNHNGPVRIDSVDQSITNYEIY